MRRDTRRKVAGSIIAASVALSSLIGTAVAEEASSTQFISWMATDDGRQSAVVGVTPAPEDGKVIVKYFKRKNRRWVLRSKQRAESMGPGLYMADFKRARRGKCKLVAIFKGNDELSRSKAVKKINCKTGIEL